MIKRMSRFRGPLCLVVFLVASLPLGGARPQEPGSAQAERDRLVQKVREVNRWGPEARIVGDVAKEIDRIISDGIDAEIRLGWGLTGDGKAYRLKWQKSTFSFEALSEADAMKAGFERMSMGVVRLGGVQDKPSVPKLTREETFARGLPYHISEVPGQSPQTLLPEQKVTFRVRVARGPGSAPEATMEIHFRFSGGDRRNFSYLEFPAAGSEKEFPVDLAWDKDFVGQQQLHCVVTVVSKPQVVGGQVKSDPLSNSLLFTVQLGSK